MTEGRIITRKQNTSQIFAACDEIKRQIIQNRYYRPFRSTDKPFEQAWKKQFPLFVNHFYTDRNGMTTIHFKGKHNVSRMKKNYDIIKNKDYHALAFRNRLGAHRGRFMKFIKAEKERFMDNFNESRGRFHLVFKKIDYHRQLGISGEQNIY